MASEKIELPINGPTYTARGRGANLQDCINWYPESDPTSKSKMVLYPTPGSRFIDDIGLTASNPIRGLITDPIESDEKMWAVVGDQFFSITPASVTASVGYVVASYWDFNYTEADATEGVGEDSVTVATLGTMTGIDTTTPIMMVANKDWVFILAAGNGEAWTWNKNTSTLAKVTDVDYPFNQTPSLNVNTVAYQDGYFVVTVQDTELFYISELNDPTAWDGLSFASAEKDADAIVRAFSTKREMWFFGKNTTEVWINTGGDPVPFEPLPNVLFDIGLLAPLSVSSIDDTILILGRDKTGWGRVFQFTGFDVKPVSNPAIESMINTTLDTFVIDTNVTTFADNIVAYTYKDRGHSFYVLTIPAAADGRSQQEGSTLVYDINEGVWHTRKSKFSDTDLGEIEGRHFSGETFTMSRYKHYTGHYINNNLYIVDVAEFADFVVRDEDGVVTSSTPINRQRTSPYITDRLNRIFWNSVEVDIQSGIFNQFGSIEFPSIKLSWSNDDGQTFSSGVTRTVERGKRIRFNRLGHSRDRVYRLTTFDPANVVVLGTYAEIYQGNV